VQTQQNDGNRCRLRLEYVHNMLSYMMYPHHVIKADACHHALVHAATCNAEATQLPSQPCLLSPAASKSRVRACLQLDTGAALM
jgi:hypothetical protein